MATTDPAVAAIEYALNLNPGGDGMAFLRCWMNGEFPEIHKEWADAPEEVFIGADPLHPKTRVGLEHDLRSLADDVLALRSQSSKQSEIDRLKEIELEICATTMKQAADQIERGDYWPKTVR